MKKPYDRSIREFQSQVKKLPILERPDEIDYFKKQSEAFAESGGDEKMQMQLINELNDKASKLKGINMFQDEIARYGKNSNPEGLVDSFKISKLGGDLIGILDGKTDMVEEDGDYVFMMHDPKLEKQNLNDIQDLKTKLKDLDEGYEFGGVDEFEYIDEQDTLYNQIFELEQDITKGSKRSYKKEELIDLMEGLF